MTFILESPLLICPISKKKKKKKKKIFNAVNTMLNKISFDSEDFSIPFFSHKIKLFTNLVRCHLLSLTHQSTQWRLNALSLDQLSMIAYLLCPHYGLFALLFFDIIQGEKKYIMKFIEFGKF